MILNPAEIRALIHRTTRRTGAPVHDEDLEQDIAVQVLEAFQRLHDVTHPRGLLIKIVQDAVRDYWRRKRSPEDLENIDERFISHAPQFESNLDHQRRLDLLQRALDRLPATKRTLLELFYLRDYSITEIALWQKRSISAVKMELARSRQSLSRIFVSLAGQSRQSLKTTTKSRE